MPTKKPFRIGIFVICSDPYWVQALEAIVHTNHMLGDELITLQPVSTNLEMRHFPPLGLVEKILASSLDAFITTSTDESVVAALLAENLPVVCLAEIGLRHPKLVVTRSLFPGGVMAGEFIGKKLGGKGRAVCVSAGLEAMHIIGQSRLAGFKHALAEYPGITMDAIQAYWDYAAAFPVLERVLKTYPHKIDALFGVSDTLALAAREAGRQAGVMDDHTLVVGLNGDPLALAAVAEGQFAATIDTASEALGAEAMRVAHRAAAGEPLPEMLPQDIQLIDRSNVGKIATRKLIAIADIPSHMVGYNRQQELERITELEKSMEISRRVASLKERDRLVKDIGSLVNAYYGYEWMMVFRWSEKDHALEFYEGNPSPASTKVPFQLDELLMKVFESRESIFIPDLLSSQRWKFGDSWAGVRSRAILPITAGDHVSGILDLQSAVPSSQLALESVGLEFLATQLGVALQNVDMFQDVLQARQAAEKANLLKTRLVANVSHEMRTPLNAILGFSQSIEKKLEADQPLDSENLQHDVHRIYKSGEHLMYMINDLLDLSRAEIGALNLIFEPVELYPLLLEVYQSFAKPSDVTSPVEWSFEVPDRLPLIRGDIIRLRQILINLLSNAGKFTRQGKITLGADIEPPYVHVWVSDTGSGVSLEMQSKIFEPFGSMVHKGRREGIGLGLSITRHLVTLHDGLITLDSAPGAGSTFHVYLPLPGVAAMPLIEPAKTGPQAIFVLSEKGHVPAEIQAIGLRQNLQVVPIHRRTDLQLLLAEMAPAAIAWDYSCASPEEWFIVNRMITQPKLASLPVIFYNSGEVGCGEPSGLTHLVFKPNSMNAFSDWLEQVRPGLVADPSCLIVDDDPEARHYYRGLLTQKLPKSVIHEAEDGWQAIDFLEQAPPPGLVLLDLVMPEMDGFAVLHRIRHDDRTRNIPVIIMSGKMLDYQDIQRLDSMKTFIAPKGILSDQELLRLMQAVLEDRELLPQPTGSLVKRGLAFIHQNSQHDIGRRELAAELGISANYLTDIFRQEMEISPMDYLTRVRIHKAKELLTKSNVTITAVAIRVGYADAAYFSRVFRKTVGLTPIEYRRNCGKVKRL